MKLTNKQMAEQTTFLGLQSLRLYPRYSHTIKYTDKTVLY